LLYQRKKVHLVGYNSVADNTSLSCSAVIASETREMSRNSKRIWPYSSSRSSKVIDLGVNGKPICDFLLVINCNFSCICYRFEIFTLKDRKVLILPTLPCLMHPLGGNPLEFLDETYPAKTRGMGVPCYRMVKIL